MTLIGDLEHFPLVDIIQLLHMNRKTGILHLKSPKGESQLVFNDGYFVGANHLDNSIRVGSILITMKAMTQAALNQALAEQNKAGKDRKPLVAMLIEQGTIDRETAFKGLETLIELTIVEVLAWKVGTFSFDNSNYQISDEYRYFPETLHMDIVLSTHGILMESLRMYDEMMRDGTLHKMFFSGDNGDETTEPEFDAETKEKTVRCLDALDTVSRKVQDLFSGLRETVPAAPHQSVTATSHQDELVTYLTQISSPAEDASQDYSLLPTCCEVRDE